MVAKGWLTCQKFLVSNSYIHVKFLENDKRNDIVNTVTQAMDEVSAENSESNV